MAPSPPASSTQAPSFQVPGGSAFATTPAETARLDQRIRAEPLGASIASNDPVTGASAMANSLDAYQADPHGARSERGSPGDPEGARAGRTWLAAGTGGESPGSIAAPPTAITSTQATRDGSAGEAPGPAGAQAIDARAISADRARADQRPTAAADPWQQQPIDTAPLVGGAVPTMAAEPGTHPDTPAESRSASAPPTAQIADRLAPALMRVETSGFGTASLTVRLDPVELGQVEIRIEQAPDLPARVHILAERPETLALLRQDHAMLEQALDRAGVKAEAREIILDLAPSGTISAQAVAPDRAVATRADEPFQPPDAAAARSGTADDQGNQPRQRQGDGGDAGPGLALSRDAPPGREDAGRATPANHWQRGDWRRPGLNITA